MKTFRITIKNARYYVHEIEANDFSEAKELAKSFLWHGNFTDWGSSYEDNEVHYVEEAD